ncbi:MAG: hypothetical protein ACTSRG_26825 [Candidatus Helarchaeota archaeon]
MKLKIGGQLLKDMQEVQAKWLSYFKTELPLARIVNICIKSYNSRGGKLQKIKIATPKNSAVLTVHSIFTAEKIRKIVRLKIDQMKKDG